MARDIALRAATPAGVGTSLGDNADQIGSAQDTLMREHLGDQNRLPKVLAPGAISSVPLTLNAQAPQYFKNGATYWHLIGRIDYTDAFSVKHWMKFCFFVSNPRGDLLNCHEGNDEDRNPESPPTSKR